MLSQSFVQTSLVVAILLLLNNSNIVQGQVVPAETLLRTFDWDAKACSDYPFGSDYYKCGVLIFCDLGIVGNQGRPLYGYKQSDSVLASENNICSSPGPTFRVEPGKKYLLTLLNTVPGQITNIHTHGAHISGDGNADNILRTASTNQAIHYNWNIPVDHMGGTHWYHSHKHEFSYFQTLGGALGLFIVEDNITSLVPNDILTNAAVGPNIIEFLSSNNEKIIMGTNLQEKFHGNGIVSGGGNINIIKDTWTRIRLGVSDPKQTLGRARQTIQFVPFSQSQFIDAYVIAYDGIYRTDFITNSTVPFPFKPAHLPVDIVGSGRIDIAVRCNNFTGSVDLFWGDKKLIKVTVIEPSIVPRTIIPDPYNYLSVYNEITMENSTIKSSWIPNRPFYNRDLSVHTLQQLNKTGVTLITTDYLINDIKWDPKVALRSDNVNDINEWTLKGTTGHPLHLHIHHFQIISSNCGKHEQYQFYDTISSPEPCIVRFPYEDFAGLTVLHCHDLDHEDGGMMTWVDVKGTDGIETIRPNVNDVKFYPKPKSNSCMSKTEFNCQGGDGRTIKAVSGTTCNEICSNNPDSLVGKRSRRCTFPWFNCRRIPKWQCGTCVPLV